MSVQDCLRVPEARERLSPIHGLSNARVLSLARGHGSPKECLESALRSALRWNDPELDQILFALKEISHGLKSGVPNGGAAGIESGVTGLLVPTLNHCATFNWKTGIEQIDVSKPMAHAPSIRQVGGLK
jgi:hypothetical protein